MKGRTLPLSAMFERRALRASSLSFVGDMDVGRDTSIYLVASGMTAFILVVSLGKICRQCEELGTSRSKLEARSSIGEARAGDQGVFFDVTYASLPRHLKSEVNLISISSFS